MDETPLRADDAPGSIYGVDGRPMFFQDPAMDRFVAVILNLASELWVQTERVADLTHIVVSKGLASADEMKAIAVAAEDDPEREAALKGFLNRILTPLREAGDR